MSRDHSDRTLNTIVSARANRPAFVWQDRFLPTGFARRLTAVLERSFESGRWYVVFAQSHDGKTTALRKFRRTHSVADVDGVRKIPVLATRTPTGRFSADHLVLALIQELGTVPNLRLTVLRSWLVRAVRMAGVRLIVIDDAHELTLAQLNYLRELTDQLKDAGIVVGVVLLAVTTSQQPKDQRLWRLIRESGLDARQFSNRLDGVDPLVLVPSLSKPELGKVLKSLEELYRPTFPDLKLAMWTTSMFDWLTAPTIDHARMGRVRMGAVCEVVRAALDLAWALGLRGLDPDGRMLSDAAFRLATRGDTFSRVDDEEDDSPPAANPSKPSLDPDGDAAVESDTEAAAAKKAA